MFTFPNVNFFKQCVFLQENVQHETNLGLGVFFFSNQFFNTTKFKNIPRLRESLDFNRASANKSI